MGIFFFSFSFSFFLLLSPLYAASDLQILSSTASSENEKIIIRIKIANDGPDPALNLAINIDNQTTVPLQPLAVSESREETIEIEKAPGAGGEYLIELVDSVQPDLHPASNVARVALPQPPKTADLEILEAAVENPQPVAEDGLSLKLRLRNRGPEPVSNSRLSIEMTSFQNPILNAQRRIEPLGPGEEKEIKFRVPFGKIKIPGNEGRLQLKWDPPIADPWEKNNSYVLNVLLIPRMPDIVIKEAQVDKHGSITLFVANKGNAPAAATQTVLYLNGALTRRYNTPALAPGSERRHQYGGTKVVSGTKVAVVADFNAQVEEGSEENNRTEFTAK